MYGAANFNIRETKDQISFCVFAFQQELTIGHTESERRRNHIHQLGRQIVSSQNQVLVVIQSLRQSAHRRSTAAQVLLFFQGGKKRHKKKTKSKINHALQFMSHQ